MELAPGQDDLLSDYRERFAALAGDRRTGRLLAATVRGIIGGESLLAAGRQSAQRIRRMLRGETTTRSPLDAEAVVAALQAHGVEQLRDAPSVWVIVDGSDLRQPHAAEMAHLQRVKRLDGAGTVPGYPTLNVIGWGQRGAGRAAAMAQ